jgi:CubicO group peptidase (beta-lactamase class C family)
MKHKLIFCSTQYLLLFCILAVLLASCSHPPTAVAPAQAPVDTAYWPTKGWRTSSPQEQGIDAGQLAQMQDVIKQKDLNLHSLLIIRNGYLVSETYFKSYESDTKHELWSCTKSFMSTLIGIAIDKGYINGVDQRVVDFFPEQEIANLDAQKQAMTLEDVLTMRSGLDWTEGDPEFGALYRSRDWVSAMLDKPMVEAPGTRFNYCSGCSHLLSAILQETTGMKTGDFAEQYLFKPLGISNVTWETDAKGTPIGGWGLQITPRDMAKLGYLYLRDGEWDGQQIVSAGWVERATQKHTGTDSDMGYGYQWWTHPALEAYTALGLYGQTIFVVPSADLVIVTTAEMENHDEIFKLIEDYIVPAVQE